MAALLHDPIRFEVIRNALQAYVEEMGASLAFSAYSTNIKTRKDFSCALFDRNIKMVVQATLQPAHLGSLVFSVPAVIKEYGVENIDQGDGILINDAHRGMVHLNDVSLVSPIYYKDEVFGFFANIAHHVDIGGRAPGSIAVTTDIFQDGLIIPGVKLVKKGEIDRDVFKFINANVRGKKESAGDFRAQVACSKLAQRRMLELIERFGLEDVKAAIKQIYSYTERRVRFEFQRFPQGVYEADALVDDDGVTDTPIKIKVKVVIKDGDVAVDLTGSDMQRRAPLNATFAQTFSGVAYSVKALLPPDIPLNDGFYRTVKIHAPKGSVVNCEYPAAVVGGWEVTMKTVEAVFRAFAQAMPSRVPAETKKTVLHIAFGGVDPRSGERYVFLETIAGGYGGRSSKDGPDAVQAHWQNTENSPVEELEMGYPVLLLKYELIPDSEGAGRFRGGLGLRRDYRFRGLDTTVTILADTVKFPPRGLFGGLDGKPARYLLNPDGENCMNLGSKYTFDVGPDDIVSMQTPGGGGYGSPFERDPAAVLNDVIAGRTSLKRAREVYGVAIEPESMTIDYGSTLQLRGAVGG